ncbi:MAG: hemolysin family protein [Saprospiraceae bacterium]
MGWLFLLFLIYFFCLLVERALVGLNAHDLDLLRANEGMAARQSLALSLDIRPTLSAFLLARILLVSVVGVNTAVLVNGSQEIKTWLFELSKWGGISSLLVWGIMGALLSIALALALWGLHKLDVVKNKSGLFLKRLWWLAFFCKLLFKGFIQKRKIQDATATGIELEPSMTEVASAASEKHELELLKSIVQFSDVTVKQVMQPRSKVVSVDFRTGFHKLLELVRKSEFSRLPVYDEDLDNITGILYVKDLLSHLENGKTFEWQPLIRTNVLMVPEAKRISELLQEFKQQRMHMAVVVDEYGGISGIVTMEDILEEITGDIRDEFDEDSEIRFRKIDDVTYLFEGQTLLNDVCRLTRLAPGTFDTVRGTSDTLAGLALELRGDIPLIGTEMAWNGFLLSVTIANKRRIEQIKLCIPKGSVV